MLRIYLGVSYPCKVDNREPVQLVSMAKQDVVTAKRMAKRLDQDTEKQMPFRQLSLQLSFETLRDGGIRPLPPFGKFVVVGCHLMGPNEELSHAELSHAEPRASDCNSDAIEALAGAFCSAFSSSIF